MSTRTLLKTWGWILSPVTGIWDTTLTLRVWEFKLFEAMMFSICSPWLESFMYTWENHMSREALTHPPSISAGQEDTKWTPFLDTGSDQELVAFSPEMIWMTMRVGTLTATCILLSLSSFGYKTCNPVTGLSALIGLLLCEVLGIGETPKCGIVSS